MASYQSITIVGHLGQDPDVRYTTNGDAVCNFSVAVTESWQGKGGDKKEQTTWFRVSAFRKLAEICGEYLKKGAQVMIVGKMQERQWTDKEGQERTSWELRAETMKMLGRRDGESEPRQAKDKQQKPAPSSGGGFNDFDDDIPFLQIGRGASSCVI